MCHKCSNHNKHIKHNSSNPLMDIANSIFNFGQNKEKIKSNKIETKTKTN